MHFKKSRFALLIVALLIMSMALAACSGAPEETPGEGSGETPGASEPPAASGPQQGGTLAMGFEYEPVTLDPHVTGQANAIRILRQVMATYLWIEDGQIKPWLAEEFDISEDGTVYTLKLREDVTFHDGTPLNAEAAKASFDRIVDPETKSQSAISALGPYYKDTEVVDEYTIRIILEQPYAPLMTNLAAPTLAPVSPTAVEELGDDMNLTPVGAGPFYIEEWVKQEGVVLKRYEDFNWAPEGFHEGPAYLDEIQFKFVQEPQVRISTLKTGELNIIEVVPAQYVAELEESPDYTVYKIPYSGSPEQALINCQRFPTDSQKVRQAILYGVNLPAYVDKVRAGVPPVVYNMMNSSTWTFDPTAGEEYSYDPDKAAALLAEDGWEDTDGDGILDKDGKPLKLNLHFIDQLATARENAQFVQGELAKLGFDSELAAMARSAWYEANHSGEHNMTFAGLWVADPSSFAGMYRSDIPQPFYWTFLGSERVDELFAQGDASTDRAEREEIYSEIQHIVMDQAAVLPFYENLNLMASAANVKDVRYDMQVYPVYFDTYIAE